MVQRDGSRTAAATGAHRLKLYDRRLPVEHHWIDGPQREALRDALPEAGAVHRHEPSRGSYRGLFRSARRIRVCA
jgi:hypothetical protein